VYICNVWVFCPFTVGFHIAVEWIYCKNVTKGNAFAMCFTMQECEVPKLCSFYFTTARCFYGDYVFDLKVIYRSLWIENHNCPSPAISSSIVKSLNQGCSWQLVVLAYIVENLQRVVMVSKVLQYTIEHSIQANKNKHCQWQ
jgi:hypothetical protein